VKQTLLSAGSCFYCFDFCCSGM